METDPLRSMDVIAAALIGDTTRTQCYTERTGASATTVAAHGDPVGTVADLLTGRYWIAPSDAARPLFQVSGSYSYLQGDGVDDALRMTLPATHSATQLYSSFSARMLTFNGARMVSLGIPTANEWDSAFYCGFPNTGSLYEIERGGLILATRTVSFNTDAIIDGGYDGTNFNHGLNGGAVSSVASSGAFGFNTITLLNTSNLIQPISGRVYSAVFCATHKTGADRTTIMAAHSARSGVAVP